MSLANDIIYGRTQNVARQLSQGAEVDEMDEYGYTPLIEAAIANNEEMGKLILDYNPKVNEQDVTGGTALHWTVENNNESFCQKLLEKGADPNAYTKAKLPVLLKPVLRRQEKIKRLLYQHGGDLHFAQDFINTKLIGHRFELHGKVIILNSLGRFIEVHFSGFILEFTISLVEASIYQFRNHFSARNLKNYFRQLDQIIQSFEAAAELIKFQQYMIDIDQFKKKIHTLLNRDLLLIPVGYEGHAINFIKYKNLLAKCDRGENSIGAQSVVIYKINNPQRMHEDLIKDLLYTKQSKQSVTDGIISVLDLEPIADLPLRSQVIGNCSWANTEATLPTMLYMLSGLQNQQEILEIYDIWREWDKDRALHKMTLTFQRAAPARRASIASTLAAVLFQRCKYTNAKDVERARKIIPILRHPGYEYILESYIDVYCGKKPTPEGKNLLQLLDIYGE